MTREEAIYRLKNMAWLYGSAEREQNIEAIDMAIEALQADAVDVAHDIPEYCSWSQTYTNMVQSAMADTKSADAEPQTEHDREWIIGCIKHDGFIKTHRFDKANKIILDALQFAEHFDLLKEHEQLESVVRCKDCIHWKADNEVFELGFCCVFPQKWVAETFYCADGERREP